MNKNRWYKTTLGEQAEALVAKAVAYTLQATLDAFVANAVEGEIGIVKASDNTIYATAGGAIAAGAVVFLVLKKDGLVQKTSPWIVGTDTLAKQAYVAPVKQVVDIDINGAVAIGDVLTVTVIEVTPGQEPFPRTSYNRVCATAVIATEVTALVAQINDLTNADNKDQDPCTDASVQAGDNIRLISKDPQRIFRVALSGKLKDLAATATTSTKPVHGSGSYDQVSELERIGNIFNGFHAEYHSEIYTSEEFGRPTKFADSTLNYHIYLVTRDKREDSPTPKGRHSNWLKSFFAIPTAGGPSAALVTLLGV